MNFIQYLGFFGYYKFNGFSFDSVPPASTFKLKFPKAKTTNNYLFKFEDLIIAPDFKLAFNPKAELFNFKNLGYPIKLILKF